MPELHPQLLADCHRLGAMAGGELLLSRNAALHWFILVPATGHADLLDLPSHQLQQVLADCQALSQWLKRSQGYPKVNFAALGNVVPQMHLHVVGRRTDDACWPRPVWGNLPPGPAWQPAALDAIRRELELDD
ncbi:MAG: HIT domain-containing protein [Haliea sp.]|uniref:HIT family protein n=1 Tax=Haliea sp. TaxID=1932666 RepID=UPI0032EC922D